MNYVISFKSKCYIQETPAPWMSSWKDMNCTSATQLANSGCLQLSTGVKYKGMEAQSSSGQRPSSISYLTKLTLYRTDVNVWFWSETRGGCLNLFPVA